MDNEKTEPITLKESELIEKVDSAVSKTLDDKLDEKMGGLIDEIRKSLGSTAAGEAEEQLKDAQVDLKAQIPAASSDPEIKAAEKKAKDFKSFGEFLTAIRKVRKGHQAPDPRLSFIDTKGNVVRDTKATTGHLETGEDSYGGFLVPEIFRNDLYMIALENSVVRPRATVIPMTTDSTKIPYVNDTDHSSSVFGGVIAYWTAEAAQKTASAPAFGQMELTPHKLAGLTFASDELLDDSAIALQPLIYKMFGSAWGWHEDYAFLRGTGAGQPLGILNCNALKSVYRNTSSRIMLEDLAEMYQSMLPASFPYAVWLANPTAMAELIEMGSGNATDASGKNLVYIDRVQDAPVWKIFGRPVFFTEKLPELATQGDIVFADLRYYLIGDRQPITIDMSEHIRFDYDETAWRFVLRVAGQCWPASTLTAKSGSHTYSPFVALNANTS